MADEATIRSLSSDRRERAAMAIYFAPMNIATCDEVRLVELWNFGDREPYRAKADFVLKVLDIDERTDGHE